MAAKLVRADALRGDGQGARGGSVFFCAKDGQGGRCRLGGETHAGR